MGLKAVQRNLMLFWQLSVSSELLLTKTKGLLGAGRRAYSYETVTQTIMKSLSFKGRESKLVHGLGGHLVPLHQNRVLTEEREKKKEMEF